MAFRGLVILQPFYLTELRAGRDQDGLAGRIKDSDLSSLLIKVGNRVSDWVQIGLIHESHRTRHDTLFLGRMPI